MGEIDRGVGGRTGSGDHMLAIYYLLLTVALSPSLHPSLCSSHSKWLHTHTVQGPTDTQGEPDSSQHFLQHTSRLH